MLYIVPTPVGNLADITFRALEVLRTVDFILAEDTRTSSVLLKHYEISKPLSPYHQHNEHQVAQHIADQIEAGKTVALISDAGTPGISDPGFMLVKACIEKGVKVQCLPGATAFVPALVCSGLPTGSFCFEGFLPVKKGRHTMLTHLKEDKRTLIFYESPVRLGRTLKDLAAYFGEERQACVSREISKKFEETIRGSLAELIKHFEAKPAKGEIVIVVSGNIN